MKKTVETIICIILLCLITIAIPRYSATLQYVSKIFSMDTVVIDAGHGGMDGGAESRSGTTEKNINLAIATEVKRLAQADGWRVVMTREEDRLLGRQEGSIRSKKTQDLKARKEIIDKEKPLVAVSIHLNSFKQDPSVRGAQVFYPSGPGDETVLSASKTLAETIQSELVAGLDDGTDRAALFKKDVLIFKNPKSPIVIVECGFLSNDIEAKKLEGREYQLKMAQLIYIGIMKFTGKAGQERVELIDSYGNQTGV